MTELILDQSGQCVQLEVLPGAHARARAGINRYNYSQPHHISIIMIIVIINIVITNILITNNLIGKIISIVIRSSLPSPCFSTLRRVRGERGIRTLTTKTSVTFIVLIQ